MRILVIGAGAVGGYFGGRLVDAGRDVTFLAHERQSELIRTNGLRIVSPHGNLTIHPNVILADQIEGAYELILLSVKAYSLQAAVKDFAPAVGPGTMVLPLLNGMRHLDVLKQQFGEASVLGGVCLIAAELDQDGRIVQLTDTHRLVYGELTGAARLHGLTEALQGAKFEARKSDNIVQEMWEKWVFLASLGAATCLMRANIGEIEAVAGGAEFALAIMGECSAIATACGYAPGADSLARAQKVLTTRGSMLTASMYRDMSKNAPVEVDQILVDLLERGRKLGVATPLLASATVNLQIYEARRKSM